MATPSDPTSSCWPPPKGPIIFQYCQRLEKRMDIRPLTHRTVNGTPSKNQNREEGKEKLQLLCCSFFREEFILNALQVHTRGGQRPVLCIFLYGFYLILGTRSLNESEARWLPRDVWLVTSRDPPVSTTAVLGLQVLPWHPAFHIMQGIKYRLSCFQRKHLANFTPSSAWKSGFSMWKSVFLHISQRLID